MPTKLGGEVKQASSGCCLSEQGSVVKAREADDNIKACISCVCLQSRKENMLTKIDAAAMEAETVQMLSMIDEEKDANLVITAEGLIQFANKGVTSVGFQPPSSCCFSILSTDGVGK